MLGLFTYASNFIFPKGKKVKNFHYVEAKVGKK